MKNNLVTKINFQEFIQRIVLDKQDSLVKVAPNWNGSGLLLCRSIQELAVEYQEVSFFWLDYESTPKMVASYLLEESIPTILFFKNGVLIDKLAGLTQKSIISHKINQLVNQ